MLKVIVLVTIATVTGKRQNDTDQIILFKERTAGPIGIMTTSAGAPIELKDARVTLNSNLIFNEYFMDSLSHIIRERIPERMVHPKGAGGFGYFEVTHDITRICKTKLFSRVGKKTPVAARFSPIIAEKGGIDTSRDIRGFSVKFYTEDGNFDIIGLNTPVFVVKDPIVFTSFVRSQKRNPATNLFDGNMFWDFVTLNPDSFHIFLMVFGDRGIPDGYSHMPGFGVHTFQVVNENGDSSFIRFHFIPEAGIKNLESAEARRIAADDPDYATRQLYRDIANVYFPSWSVELQILSLEDVKQAGFDVFDVTKVLPLERYPLHPVGRLVLNRNPKNYFAEIEQLAFSPINLVPGVLGSPDKVFEARRLAYRDAQYYRLGANFNKIAVNCPLARTLAYNRDGVPPVKDNEGDIPNYYPNSFHGPVPYIDKVRSSILEIYQDKPNNFEQSSELYASMTPNEQERLIENVLYSLGPVANFIQKRAVNYFTIINSDLGNRIAAGLAANRTIQYF